MKASLRSAIGIALSAILLWWTLRDVSLATVWKELSQSSVPLFMASALCATLIFPLRARRWRTILDPVAPGQPLGALWRSTAIGMMVNNVVPARAGEIARAYALTKETPVPFATAIASLAVDRLFDMLVLLLLGVVAFVDPAFPRDATIAGQSLGNLVQGAVVFVILLVAALYGLAFSGRARARVRDVLPAGGSPHRGGGQGRAAAIQRRAECAQGSPALCRRARLDNRALAAQRFRFLARISRRRTRAAVLGSALPSDADRGRCSAAIRARLFGFFEKLATVGLGIYGVGATQATSWAIGFHILSFIPITVIGLWYFTRLGLRFKEISRAAETAA